MKKLAFGAGTSPKLIFYLAPQSGAFLQMKEKRISDCINSRRVDKLN
jgi:hypothetical protein